MKPLKFIVFIACLGIVHSSLGAQGMRLGGDRGMVLPRPPQGFLSALVDPSRLTMHQSVSFSYVSVGKKTFGQGLYLNTVQYRLGDPLLVQVQWGLLTHAQGAPFSKLDPVKGLIKQASIRYRPTDNFSIRFDFSSSPVWGYGSEGYGW